MEKNLREMKTMEKVIKCVHTTTSTLRQSKERLIRLGHSTTTTTTTTTTDSSNDSMTYEKNIFSNRNRQQQLLLHPQRPQYRVFTSSTSDGSKRNVGAENHLLLNHDLNNNKFFIKKPRKVDPFAKRPNKVCDPYGQGGQPLTTIQAENLLKTLSPEWKLEYEQQEIIISTTTTNSTTNTTTIITDSLDDNNNNNNNNQPLQQSGTQEQQLLFVPPVPVALTRVFIHPDYLRGGRFLMKLSAVAEMNAHYPILLQMDRKIIKKNWQIKTTCRCCTIVLGGLSFHDFHLAMLIDVEANRPEVKELLVDTSINV